MEGALEQRLRRLLSAGSVGAARGDAPPRPLQPCPPAVLALRRPLPDEPRRSIAAHEAHDQQLGRAVEAERDVASEPA